MKTPTNSFKLLMLCIIFLFQGVDAQSEKDYGNDKLFAKKEILPIKIQVSLKQLKAETNDSTYMPSKLNYKEGDNWEEIDMKLRVRGNFRLRTCRVPPLKLKFNKDKMEDTPFKAHKSLKLVLPCLHERDKNDNVIKEYMVYAMFELISPYHFRSRLVDVELTDLKGKKHKVHTMKGFLIEDDKHMAKRLDAKVYKRKVHPLQQEDLASVRNALFQFMIANTDFSQYQSHNIKLVYKDGIYVPVPYDFDLAGFVDCSYAVVSQIDKKPLKIESVRDRLYRGFQRDPQIFAQVRQEFLDLEDDFYSIMKSCESYFEDPREFHTAKSFLESFYEILKDERSFNSEVLKKARTG